MSGLKPLSPLVFPSHLNKLTDRNVSGLDTDEELRAILAKTPGAVVIAAEPRRRTYDPDAYDTVRDYGRRNCREITTRRIRQIDRDTSFIVFGDCMS
jgi:hypothetical protein